MPIQPESSRDHAAACAAAPPASGWLRRAKGLGALLFVAFLLKGLAWLIVPAALAVLASR